MDRIERMKELAELLNKASESYYAKDVEIMSNFEYDRLYDELTALERNRNDSRRKPNLACGL